jgi:hypothetical protein
MEPIPFVEIGLQGGKIRELRAEPDSGSASDSPFVLRGELPEHHSRAEKHKIGIQRVEETIVVDLLQLPREIHLIHLIPSHVQLPTARRDTAHARANGQHVEPAGDSVGPEVADPVHEIEVITLKSISTAGEVVFSLTAVVEGSKLHQGQIKASTVESDEASLGVVRKTPPKGANDLRRAKTRSVEARNILEGEVGGHANHTDSYRNLEGDREEIAAGVGLRASVGSSASDGILGREIVMRIFDSADKSTVGDALGVED